MAGIELENYASGHEMSNQQTEKQSFPNTSLHCLGENWSLPTTSQLHLFFTTWSLLGTILDPASWWLSQSCDSCEATSGPKLWFLRSCLCCRDLGSIANIDSLEEHLWHVASILASGKTRMAPKTNKSNTACWLASNSKTMPVAMKCQINKQKSRASPTQTWIALGKTGRYLHLDIPWFTTTKMS